MYKDDQQILLKDQDFVLVSMLDVHRQENQLKLLCYEQLHFPIHIALHGSQDFSRSMVSISLLLNGAILTYKNSLFKGIDIVFFNV